MVKSIRDLSFSIIGDLSTNLRRNLKIGLWNIDHPEVSSANKTKERRFRAIQDYLISTQCDMLVITEANAAMELPGYFYELSSESPYRSSTRFYGKPNSYHQVAIYSKYELRKLPVTEPVNGLLCEVIGNGIIDSVYGNVVTIKDRWSSVSEKTYTNRLDEQIAAIKLLPRRRSLVAGDFNLKLGWAQKRRAYNRVKEELKDSGWLLPTELNRGTVQHVLHSPDMKVEVSIDFEVQRNKNKKGLSDHPFMIMNIALR
jgi:hypothetical protein